MMDDEHWYGKVEEEVDDEPPTKKQKRDSGFSNEILISLIYLKCM